MTQPAKPLTIEHIAPGALRPDLRNPRAHKPTQIDAIARSIRTFGFNVPVLIDGAGLIIAGHGRVTAAVKIGMAEIPAVRVEHLSDLQRQAYAIADNRLTDTSKWDDQLLGEVLRDLTLSDLDFELDAIGFSVGEIDFRIDAIDGDLNDPDDEMLIAPGPAVCLIGDVWQLGRHRLLCGNSLEPENWKALLAGEKAAMTFSDPPYNVAVHGHVSGLGAIRHREFAMASGEMDRDTFTNFLSSIFTLMVANSHPGSLHYACMDWRHMGEMIEAGEQVFTELKNLCVWSKPAGSMGSLYRSQHELVFVWKNGRARHRNNVELGRNGRNRTNVWCYPSISGFRHSEDSDLLALHPTCKPVALVADTILDVTARGDLVLDPFMGSGTTLIAAEKVGRIAYGLELDPLYCDTIIRRWERWTGDKAVYGDGTTFEDRATKCCVVTSETAT